MKILFLTRYASLGASSRLRILQFLPEFRSAGIQCTVSHLIDDAVLHGRYQRGRYLSSDLLRAYWRRLTSLTRCSDFDLIFIEKEALPWLPVWFEKWLLRSTPYVLDFDDAVFHNYDSHRVGLMRFVFGRRIDELMAGARLVVAGNSYLAARAFAAKAAWVETVPTVVDIARYAPREEYAISETPRIVWIGSPSTAQYLSDLAVPLASLAKRRSFTLRVISDGTFAMEGVQVEPIAWSAETEASLIADCDIGIMPLRNTPWEQGKCAYKLIQYMACGLPTVSTPVGANRDVVLGRETGFFASTPQEWVDGLDLLLDGEHLRRRLGHAGRRRVETTYSLQAVAPRLTNLLVKAARFSSVSPSGGFT